MAVLVAATLTVAFFALPLGGLLARVNWGTLWADLTTRESRAALRLSLTSALAATAVVVALGLRKTRRRGYPYYD